MVGLLTALPNTQLWHRLKEEGRLLKQSVGSNTLVDLNFIPKMDTQELLAGYQRILKTIYNPKEYFERASAFLSQLGASARAPMVFSDLMALRPLALAAGRVQRLPQGLLEVRRARRCTADRQHFDKAITLAIMGHHFFALTWAGAEGLDARG